MGLIDYIKNKKKPNPLDTENYSSSPKEDPCTIEELVFELLNGSTKIHLAHLKVTGTGSYAAHKAMNDFYDEIKSMADGIAESYQGATGKLMDYPKSCEFPEMKNAEDCIKYLDKLTQEVISCQNDCIYTEIVNDLDGVKTLINQTKYKLMFLS